MAMQPNAPSETLLRDYMRAPKLAVPTALLAIFMLGGMALVWYLCLTGRMSFWAGALVNGLLSYGLFSPIHDGAHRAISRIGWLNEAIADVSLLFLFPYAPMVALRWLQTSTISTPTASRIRTASSTTRPNGRRRCAGHSSTSGTSGTSSPAASTW